MDFLAVPVTEDKKQEFQGALPTTIYQVGFSEVTMPFRILNSWGRLK